ncbi:MAG: Gfo/Idh/MocA family oxidoreductase [Clostridia bacterium]|nr:Gfo/Idh/MocA family oxidoreductase [Clostridia bacterium]MBQ8399951.1 Gfo/Idh/MocA family oxidoreductase [Clostridia bacterium]
MSQERKIRFGLFGLGKGSSFYNEINYCGGEVVAVCDKDPDRIEQARRELGYEVAGYANFDEFLSHKGLEAVFLCNYFHEHAEYARWGWLAPIRKEERFAKLIQRIEKII